MLKIEFDNSQEEVFASFFLLAFIIVFYFVEISGLDLIILIESQTLLLFFFWFFFNKHIYASIALVL